MRCPDLYELPPPPAGKKGWPWTKSSTPLPDHMPNGNAWPKISIITPSFNQGQFIEETIRSVLLQGYPNLEYIIIDGGSKDDTFHIIKKYEKWLSYWVSEADKGQAQAINKGFRKSNGDILAWLNSDDTYMPNAFRRVAEIFLSINDIKMIYGDVNFIDKDSNFLKIFKTQQFDLISQIYTNMVPQQASFWRKEIFDHVGFLDETYHHPFDNDFFIRVGTTCKVLYEPTLLANYRLHPQSKTEIASVTFFLEYLSILSKYFQRLDIPQAVKDHEKRIFSYWHERTAHKYMSLSLKKEARYHFKKAINSTPLRIQNLTLLAYIIDTFIGSNLGKTIQILRGRLTVK